MLDQTVCNDFLFDVDFAFFIDYLYDATFYWFLNYKWVSYP